MAEYIERHALKNDGHLCWHDGKGNVYYEVDHAPTADVEEVRHGRWESVIGTRNSPKWGNNRVACSECRRSGYTRYSYCPYCGAKMDGKGEGE